MTFSQSTYRVNEENRSVQLVLILSHPVSTNITVTISTTDISAKGIPYSTITYVVFLVISIKIYLEGMVERYLANCNLIKQFALT